ncbi:MAG: hypothetical protein HN368_06765 [Spirochaetales bacterium]|nr:hypothetical protein [Spirochaetales bacterium]
MKTSMLKSFVKAAVLIGTVLVTGCGGDYTAEIAGYINDSESGAGVDGAVVHIYSEEPDTAGDEGFIVETASMSSGGNAGYFNHKIIWRNWFPAFGEEGDTGSVWLGISHGDYADAIIHVQGLLSATLNVIPDIQLERATFSIPELTGRIIDVGGEGVNGVRVVLDLASTTDDAEDYITTTGTIDGAVGTYRFTNITWRDEAPDSAAADTESVTLIVDDQDYDSATMLTTLLASDQNAEFTTDIVVIRQPRTEFTANIQGQCINRYISSTEVQEIPEQGVEVTLTFMDQDGITLHTLFDQTDVTGGFAFFVQWTDDNPRNFDGSVSTAVEDLSIPEGEDGLYVQIQFAAPFNDPALPEDSLDIDGGDDALFDSADFALKSWINPNYLPDAVIETTL